LCARRTPPSPVIRRKRQNLSFSLRTYPSADSVPVPTGKDALGSYVSVVYTYTAKSLEEGDAPFEATTAFTVYSSDLIMFEQTWVSGATGTTSNDNNWDEVRSKQGSCQK
jgi:hypothetical protein